MNNRPIDYSTLKTYELFGQRLVLVSRREIRTWKALAIITFFAGFLLSTIYSSVLNLSAEAFSFLPSFLLSQSLQ